MKPYSFKTTSFNWNIYRKTYSLLKYRYKSNISKLNCRHKIVPHKNDKLSLAGMQLPEKYKENFDVSSEGPSSGVSNYTSLYTKNIEAITWQKINQSEGFSQNKV